MSNGNFVFKKKFKVEIYTDLYVFGSKKVVFFRKCLFMCMCLCYHFSGYAIKPIVKKS